MWVNVNLGFRAQHSVTVFFKVLFEQVQIKVFFPFLIIHTEKQTLALLKCDIKILVYLSVERHKINKSHCMRQLG